MSLIWSRLIDEADKDGFTTIGESARVPVGIRLPETDEQAFDALRECSPSRAIYPFLCALYRSRRRKGETILDALDVVIRALAEMHGR